MTQQLDCLVSLVQLDIDAVHAYTSAIERIYIEDVKRRLVEFRDDHERHISDLSPLIVSLGGEPPARSPDFKGFFIQGFTALRSMMSNEGAIRAMKSNEELTNKQYDEALALEFPVEIRSIIEKNRDDERRHLEFINQCIDGQVWDRPSDRSVA